MRNQRYAMIFVHLSVPHNPVEVTKGIVVYRATDYLHLKAPWRMAMKQLLKRELRSATSVFKSLTKLLSTVGHTRAAASCECVQSMLRKSSSPLLFFVSFKLNVYLKPLGRDMVQGQRIRSCQHVTLAGPSSGNIPT